MLAASLSGLPQVEEHSRCSVNPMACLERGTDQPKQTGVLLGPIGYWALQPSVVTAASDAERATHDLNVVGSPMRLDELVNPSRAPGSGMLGHLVTLRLILRAVLACP